MVVRGGVFLVVSGLLVACAVEPFDTVSTSEAALDAVCTASVAGKKLEVETDYLPNVVMCENGGAPLEALKVQAIAARTFLYFKIETSGSIGDGQGDQVYSCGKKPSALVLKAVAETSGLVLRHGGVTLASFYVAGGKGTPPACVGGSASTETYVTYNLGLSGNDVKPTSLGSKSNPRNRGCMSQNGASCLAGAGEPYDDILRFYYGEDVVIERATGSCVSGSSVPSTPDAGPPPAAGADEEVPPNEAGCSASPRLAGTGGGGSFGWLLAIVGLRSFRNRKRKQPSP